MGLSRG